MTKNEHIVLSRVLGEDTMLGLRVNTLKVKDEEIVKKLKKRAVDFDPISWYQHGLMVQTHSWSPEANDDLVKEGMVYKQDLSSMFVPVVLDPKPGERVLDLCAAPGSKTTQMAAMMNNQGEIVAVEKVKNRYYRLRSVAALLNAQNITFKLMDGRRLRARDDELFDKILVDAPCSSEGRFRMKDKKTYAYWSPRKIKEMQRKQKGLLLNASRLLKTHGVMVYSTCTFAPEENEAVVDWLLRKTDGALEIEPVDVPGIRTYPAVAGWNNKRFQDTIKHCLRILPTEETDGFFITKLRKVRP